MRCQTEVECERVALVTVRLHRSTRIEQDRNTARMYTEVKHQNKHLPVMETSSALHSKVLEIGMNQPTQTGGFVTTSSLASIISIFLHVTSGLEHNDPDFSSSPSSDALPP